jgi:hypothetical protein
MAALTTVYGVQHTKYKGVITDGTSGMASFVTQQWNSRVQMVHDEYTVAATDTMAAGGVFNLGIVPKGARCLFAVVTYTSMAVAVTGTIKVGALTLGAVSSMTNAGSQVVGALIACSGTPLTADSAVTITTADQTVPASANITCTVFYIQDGVGA